MKLQKILDLTNQTEKAPFLKMLESISPESKNKDEDIELTSFSKANNYEQLKSLENKEIVKLFSAAGKSYSNQIKQYLDYNTFHLDILISIIIRDGNCIMSREWFQSLYKKEIDKLRKNIISFNKLMLTESYKSDNRYRDYDIYLSCVKIAFENDMLNNQDKKITKDEKTILNVLADKLNLSLEEQRIIFYSILEPQLIDIDILIKYLKDIGLIFYRRKDYNIYIPNEFIWNIRDILGIELPNKFLRRILRKLKDSEINNIAKEHNINYKTAREEKINLILNAGLNVRYLLSNSIYKSNTNKTDKKLQLQELIEKKLEIKLSKLGSTLEEKINNFIHYFKNLEKDDNIGMSIEGYEKLLKNLFEFYPELPKIIKDEFELQQENMASVELMTNYLIRPLDILNLLSKDELIPFNSTHEISTRGNLRTSILKAYKDTENLFIENFDLIGSRNIAALKEKGINIKESELGLKYESIAKKIFTQLGYEVSENIKKMITSKKNIPDIVLKVNENKIIIVECKTIKDKKYNKYSTISRQLKSYTAEAQKNNFDVAFTIILSNDFSDDFISESNYDCDFDPTLATSEQLKSLAIALKASKRDKFPIGLLKKIAFLDITKVIEGL